MRFPGIVALALAFACSPALAIDSAPDEAAEDDTESDSYIPNRFAITIHGEYAHFNQSRNVNDTGGGGGRIGFRLSKWIELELGVDYYKTGLHGDDAPKTDIGTARLIPLYLEARIDITNIDKKIPWPLPWCRPLIMGGVGLGFLDVKEEVDAPINIEHRGVNALVRGGAGIEFGQADSRLTFGFEFMYTWVANDIKVDDPTGNLPGRLNLDYWTIGAYVTLRF